MYETKEITYKENAPINFLYNTMLGRIFLNALIRPSVSKLLGSFMDSSASKILIKNFIKRNNIQMDEYERADYSSFNDFFIREIKKSCRPLAYETMLFAPCDGKLTAYPITADSIFHIKNSKYDVENLLQDKKLADEFTGGVCLIFRLMPDDYHRYHYIDDGEILSQKAIRGVLHTTRHISLKHYKIYLQNSREYSVMQTEKFGKIIQMEVGALFVGRITNHKTKGRFARGDEKGFFEFGGSTVVMLFQKDTVKIDSAIYDNTQQNKESVVRMGQKIGECLQKPTL